MKSWFSDVSCSEYHTESWSNDLTEYEYLLKKFQFRLVWQFIMNLSCLHVDEQSTQFKHKRRIFNNYLLWKNFLSENQQAIDSLVVSHWYKLAL